MSEIVETRWGRWIEHINIPHMRVKTLVITHGKAISLQYHKHRSEHWKVLSGYGILLTGYLWPFPDGKLGSIETRFLEPGMEVEISANVVHKVIALNYNNVIYAGTNLAKSTDIEPLVITEVQTGDILTEDDIVRLEPIDESI